MGQQFKSVYLNDQMATSDQKSTTLAFGDKDLDLYSQVKDLSSVEIRELLGSNTYSGLEKKAQMEGRSLNSYCLYLLRKALKNNHQSTDLDQQLINPIHTTFRGGIGDPLHNWYPYLEGYSPDFVTAIIDRYLSTAKSIYDPFSGSGTTPIAVALRGISASYSEVNPVMQIVSEAKISARQLSATHHLEVISNLNKISENLEQLVEGLPVDTLLDTTYKACFGNSKFFDEATYNDVLKLRTYADILGATSPTTAKFFTVAILRALVPASLLQRSGDLRYKTAKEIANKKVSLIPEIKKNITMMAQDLEKVNSIDVKPILLTENAKNIGKLPKLNIDGVVTSPPYLNGTNYFRNTKVELWFIRGISEAKDLTAYRARAVTAGINDVTNRYKIEKLSDNLQNLVSELETKSYDQRIAKMVHYYFIDMIKIFKGLTKHLTKGAVVAIDIGDSIYSNVHVPTDAILKELLTGIGYELVEDVTLRKRTSRNGGQALKQVLLVFKYVGRSQTKSIKKRNLPVWESFKNEQPHHTLPYSKRNWGNSLHSLCSYQGKMKPSLAYFLIKSFTKPGDRMLDPFVGVGTIPFEGALNGVQTFGFDISPAALVISQAKLGNVDAISCEHILNELEGWIKGKRFTNTEFESAARFGYNRKLAEYYNKDTLGEILSARNYFKQVGSLDDNHALVMSCLLHILHGNRPYALSRRSHGITPFAPSGDFEYRELMPRLRVKVRKSINVDPGTSYVPGKTYFQDITASWPAEVDDLDSIITSPPFFDSTRFYQANWLRLWFAGWNDEDFKLKPKIFIDEKQKKSFDVYETIFRQSRERLKEGGHLVLHLGKSKKSDMAAELAVRAKPWFNVIDVFSENVDHTESHGIRDKGTVTEHQFLILG